MTFPRKITTISPRPISSRGLLNGGLVLPLLVLRSVVPTDVLQVQLKPIIKHPVIILNKSKINLLFVHAADFQLSVFDARAAQRSKDGSNRRLPFLRSP